MIRKIAKALRGLLKGSQAALPVAPMKMAEVARERASSPIPGADCANCYTAEHCEVCYTCEKAYAVGECAVCYACQSGEVPRQGT